MLALETKELHLKIRDCTGTRATALECTSAVQACHATALEMHLDALGCTWVHGNHTWMLNECT